MAGQRITWAIMFATAGVLTSCGGGSPEKLGTVAAAPLELHSDSANYSMQGSHTTLRGTVTPGATVSINGQRAATVQGTHWSRTVAVSVGENVFAVLATMAGHVPATQNITVTRTQSGPERAVEAEHNAAAAAAEEQRYKERATSIPYKELNKDAEAYKGKIVHYEGQIFQIQEEPGGGGNMLLSVTNNEGFWTDHIYVNYTGHVKGTEKSIVNVYGEVTGSKSYKTQIGGETYVPEVQAKYVIG
jgi:hypothetical protein